jgi:hypothetical protein
MPTITLSKATCPHRGQHPIWTGRKGQPVAVCLMPLPYLKNCIRLLNESLQNAYELNHKFDTQAANDEAVLSMLLIELKRRKDAKDSLDS